MVQVGRCQLLRTRQDDVMWPNLLPYYICLLCYVNEITQMVRGLIELKNRGIQLEIAWTSSATEAQHRGLGDN